MDSTGPNSRFTVGGAPGWDFRPCLRCRRVGGGEYIARSGARARPEEVARRWAFSSFSRLQKDASYITGRSWFVDGGNICRKRKTSLE